MLTPMTVTARLRARFSRLDLRAKIASALIAVFLLAGALFALASFLMMRAHIIESAQSLMAARAQIERREIELKLEAVFAEAASLAGNTATANALADSLGRETYLQPLLQNYKLSWPGATLTLTDHRGNPVAKSATGEILGADARSTFAGMMRSNKAFASLELHPKGERVLSVAFPVIYRLTGSIEGAVLLQLDPAKIALPDAPEDWALHDSAGRLIAGSAAPKAALQVRSALTLPEFAGRLGLTHTLSLDRDLMLRDLDYLLAAYFVFGLLLVYGAIRLSHAAAGYLSAPLRQLTDAAEQMAASGRPTAWIALGDEAEFNRLAQAFNSMVNRLGASYAELESRVTQRTLETETARQAAEKARRLLQEAVSSVALGFTIYDEADRLVLCNEAYLKLYDMSGDAIVPGTTFEQILRMGLSRGQYQDPEAIADPEAWARKRVAQHQRANGEVVEQKLGDGRWLLAVEYRTASGYIVGNRFDVTRLKQTEEALRERTEQLNVVFELSPDGFASFDTAHRIRYVSPAFTRLTGLEPESVIGTDEAEFSRLLAAQCLPGAAFRGVAALRESMGAAQPGASARRELIEIPGPEAHVLEAGLRESQAASVSQILYVRDVTREMEVDRMKSEFLSTAAHELRTPMASIFGFAELLMGGSFDRETQLDLIQTIHRNADLMASIINELLDLARIEARRGKDFIFETVQAQALVQRIVANFKPPEGRDAPQLALPAQALWLRADPNGRAVRVTLLARGGDEGEGEGPGEGRFEIGLSVADRGMGMKPEQLARVCERFYRADTSGKIPGTGLGMSIVSEILKLHRGRVEINSIPGTGTEVTLWLAAADAPAAGELADFNLDLT
ncbi:MAG: PAS-domain containing protein [Proteobacteria bacterium]|nr:PAS-domain containing protein [Pseudomonadota bacterium]